MMFRLIAVNGLFVLIWISALITSVHAAKAELEDYSYIIGRRHALDFFLNNLPVDAKAFERGFRDALESERSPIPFASLKSIVEKTDSSIPKLRAAMAAENLRVGELFINANRDLPGVTETDRGLLISEVSAGSGASPELGDTVLIDFGGPPPNGCRGLPFSIAGDTNALLAIGPGRNAGLI